MNNPNEENDPDRLSPLTEAEEIMWAESRPGERITPADAAARLAEICARPATDEIRPPIPAHPRPGTRTIVATTAEYGRWKLTRVGLDVDDAIEEEVNDYLYGLKSDGRDVALDSPEAIAYAESQPDVALWEGERCLAVIRPRPGGEPEVTRFDGLGDDRPLPVPSTEAERFVWGMIKEYGTETCRDAICRAVLPGYGPKQPASYLTPGGESILTMAEGLGFPEARRRMTLSGPYGVIYDAITRLGSDAVDELRRIIAAGKVPAPVEVQAATVVEDEATSDVEQEQMS